MIDPADPSVQATSQPTGLALRWTIGGMIGGVIGAAVWAAISYYANVEIGWIAIGVGALVGFGVVTAGAGHTAGAFTGCIAAGIALLSIAGGKYASIHFTVQKILGETGSGSFVDSDFNDGFLHQLFVDEIAYERLDAGEDINWPDPDMTIDEAEWPDDYPADLQRLARERVSDMSEEERAEFVQSYIAMMDQGMAELAAGIKRQAFIDSFGVFDVVFIALALFTAFQVAGKDHSA